MVDAAWLHMDEPTNLAVITGVMTFDAPLDFERLRATLIHRLLPFERFRQRVVERPLRLGLPHWQADPHFTLSAHLHRIALPAPGDQATLQAVVGDLMSMPLDISKPLWHMHYIENYGTGSALVARIHHCVADGLALVQVLLSLTDPEADAPWPEAKTDNRRSWNPLAALFKPARAALRATQSAFIGGLEMLARPARLIDLAKLGASSTYEVGKLVLTPPDERTLFKGRMGVTKRVAWSAPIPLSDIKAIGKATESTVNDVLLAAVAGALRRYLEGRDEPVEATLNLRALVPVNLRPLDDVSDLGNRFGLVLLSLPVGMEKPRQRLEELKHRMKALKQSPEAAVAFGILGAMGLTPADMANRLTRFFGTKASAVMTNVPGPRAPLYMAGQAVQGIMFWVPAPGRLGLGVSIFSYAGSVLIGIATDARRVPDPDTLVEDFHAELEQMKRWTKPPQRASKTTKKPRAAAPAEGRCAAQTKAGQPCQNRALPGAEYCRRHAPQP